MMAVSIKAVILGLLVGFALAGAQKNPSKPTKGLRALDKPLQTHRKLGGETDIIHDTPTFAERASWLSTSRAAAIHKFCNDDSQT
jgi:hypothetical protein